ncbi:MAG TPA: hypothetical protein VFE62_22605 [Gemmataceae bacterium]|nr:hypothetical protein [Gemmataceae bacterium]
MIVLSAFAIAGNLYGQEGKEKQQPPEPFEAQGFWLQDAGVAVEAWACLLGQVQPMGGAWNPVSVPCGRLLLGHPEKGLPEWKFTFDEVLPIWHRYLDAIQDGRILPNVDRKQLSDLRGPDWGMYLALVQAVDRSQTSTLSQFEKSAQAFDFVQFPHLQKTPGAFRGKIITVKGNVRRILKSYAPRHTTSDIQFIYTTEIRTREKKEPPFAVMFTELPPGVSYKDPVNLDVTFYGYFLGMVSFPGDVKKRERDVTAPYLVGKTLIVGPVPAVTDDEGSYSYKLIVSAGGAILSIFVLTVLLNFWFRRGDRRIESQLAQVRDKHHPFSLEPEPDVPPIAEPIAQPAQPTETHASDDVSGNNADLL